MPLIASSLEPLEARIAPAFAARFNLANLDGHNGFAMDGVASGDFFGRSVAGVGDVNGDGFSDFIVGADYADGHGKDSGVAYVVFGKRGGFPARLSAAALDGHNGFQLIGASGNNLLGSSVSSAGDVNGDGIDDLIVGARVAGDTGAAYVVFGSGSGFAPKLQVTKLNGVNGFKLDGPFGDSQTGISVSGGFDFNGDGFDDIIVGAEGAGPNGYFPGGAAYIVFGTASGFPPVMELGSLSGTDGFEMDGAVGDVAGRAVSGGGDVNGDGFGDVIVGAYGASPHGTFSGAAYVVFGRSSGFGTMDLSTLDGKTGFKLSGEGDHGHAGASVSGGGDVNGDGFDDIIVGSYEAPVRRGSAYVFFGKSGEFSPNYDLEALNGENGFRIKPPPAGYDYGIGVSVNTGGDINGDGFDDVLIGQKFEEQKANGACNVIFGHSSSFPATLEVNTLDGVNGFRILGTQSPRLPSPFAAATGGDINGDGLSDIVIGALSESGAVSFSGAAYVVFGGDPGRLHIAKSGLSASYTDPDGDKLTVQTSAGKLTSNMFDMRADGLGFQLEKFTLTDAAFTKTSLTISALQQDANKDGTLDGDGVVTVGAISAAGVDLGKVKIGGDLGQIDAGDGDPAKAALALLKVQSLGAHGTATQDATTASLHSDLAGDLKKLTLKAGVSSGVTLAVAGKIGAATIAGDLENATISVLGALAPATAEEAVALGSLTIGGKVAGSRILAGYDLTGVAANANVSIGTVFVRGTWTASDLVAGIADVTGDGFGRNDAVIPGGSAAIIARIAEVTLRGGGFGTSENTTDSFAITAEQLGEVRIFGTPLPLTEGKDNLPISGDGDFRAVEL